VIEWAEWRIWARLGDGGGPGGEGRKEGGFDNIWGCAFTGHRGDGCSILLFLLLVGGSSH
jgi:hypothetical protein